MAFQLARRVVSAAGQQRLYHRAAPVLSGGLRQHQDTPDNTQETTFDFTVENYQKVDKILARYPGASLLFGLLLAAPSLLNPPLLTHTRSLVRSRVSALPRPATAGSCVLRSLSLSLSLSLWQSGTLVAISLSASV